MTTRRTQFPGVPFPQHAPKYIIPGLSLRQLRDNKALIGGFLALEKTLTSSPTMDDLSNALDAAGKIAHLAVSRNYPDVAEDEVADIVDMNNLQALVQAIMGASGFKLVTSLPEEVAGAQAGEPQEASGQ